MIRIILFSLIYISFSNNTYSQYKFEKGYYIDNDDKKIECLIQNSRWTDNPTEIKYKLLDDSKIYELGIKSIKAFEINELTKFVRANVDIDRSSLEFNHLTRSLQPEFNKEELLLKVLVAGKSNLYYYKDAGLIRFFYDTSVGEIKQLVYRKFRDKDNEISYDNSYWQQLHTNVNCENQSMEDIAFLEYEERLLVDYFITENLCHNSEYKFYETQTDKFELHFSIRPGLHRANTRIGTYFDDEEIFEFEVDNYFRIGAELEFLERHYRKKWAIIVEPSFLNYQATSNSPDEDSAIDLKTIVIPTGLRYYVHLSHDSKLFLNASINLIDFSFKPTLKLSNVMGAIRPEPRGFLAFGLGYKFKNTYSIELRANTAQDIIGTFNLIRSSHESFALIFGYTI